MKLDPKTLSVLQNFQTINPSIAIFAGNTLRTISPVETIVASAVVPDTFPIDFGIFNLSRFLAVISLLKDADIEFKDTHMIISDGKSKVKFVYCGIDTVKVAPTKINVPSVDIQFDLPHATFSSVMKAMQILGYSEIAFIGDGNTMTISTINSKNSTSDIFSTVIGETDKNFEILIDAEKMKLYPDDYNVKISKMGIAHFKGSLIEYWIPPSDKSKFE